MASGRTAHSFKVNRGLAIVHGSASLQVSTFSDPAENPVGLTKRSRRSLLTARQLLRGEDRFEVEKAARVLPQNRLLCLEIQERQIVNRARQIHVPVRIVRRVEKLRLR